MGHCAATDLPVARSVMCSQYPSYASTTVSYSIGLPFAGQPHLAYMQELAFVLKGVQCTTSGHFTTALETEAYPDVEVTISGFSKGSLRGKSLN